jgi:hypothetical protein
MDFDILVNWRKENSVDIDTYMKLVKPEGVRQAKQQDMYFEVFPNRSKLGLI